MLLPRTWSQSWAGIASHVQPAPAATAKVPSPPVGPTEALEGVNVKEQPTPDCETVKARPWTTMLADRAAPACWRRH